MNKLKMETFLGGVFFIAQDISPSSTFKEHLAHLKELLKQQQKLLLQQQQQQHLLHLQLNDIKLVRSSFLEFSINFFIDESLAFLIRVVVFGLVLAFDVIAVFAVVAGLASFF